MAKEQRKILQFHEMELDDRLLKAICQLGWLEPTLIQEAAIPLLLEGKNVIIKARTGSGKTAAYALPLIQKILNNKLSATEQCITTVILTPTKELCEQTRVIIEQMCNTCDKTIKVADLSINELATQKHLLSQKPDILMSTPAKVLLHLQENNLNLKYLETLIVDEADLVFSYGFEKDFQKIVGYLPPIYQMILVSATITEEMIQMKSTILKNPVILKLEESEIVPATQLSHQCILAEENDKPAILYALLKLRLIRGKNIIFVNSVDRCYKLKLFMEQIGIKSCALNSELPSKIRIHTINQFNKGIYDFIIASDEYTLEKPGSGIGRVKKDCESSASRGIDFQYVTNVINFDYPKNVTSYIHRAGRTARGQNKGTVLSFVCIKDQAVNNAVEAHLQAGYLSEEQIIKNYQFKLEEVEPFRYRAQDAWRAITRIAVHEARIREIRQELFNSEKLKGFFSEHSHDLEVLRHDKPLKTIKIQPHLSHVPEYIIPQALKRLITTNSNTTTNGSAAATISAGNTTNKKMRYFHSSAKAIYENKMTNPLLCSGLDFGKKTYKKSTNQIN